MYGNNPYMRNFNQQNIYEQIDNEINNLQQMKERMKNQVQQPAINQTFQLAPTNNHTIRYANTIDDVVKEMVYYDTPFFSKDMDVMWFKSARGDIKTYELTEIVPKDDKDMQIEVLQAQIEELKGKIENEWTNTNDTKQQDTTNTDTSDEAVGTTIETSKPTSVQRVPNGKKKQWKS